MDLTDYALHPAVQGLLLAMLSTLLVLRRHGRAALCMAMLAVMWVALAATPAIALRLRQGLVLPASVDHPAADAIVVLGGGKLPVADWSRTNTRAGMGLTLWREGVAPLLLVSGIDQADDLARGYALSGVPVPRLRVDNQSSNTHENAQNSAAILKAGGQREILLVTSAVHMRRAAGCFRHEGLTVVGVPAADRSALIAQAPAWLPRRDALTLTARCLHEYVALWLYRQRGWI